MYLNTKYIQFFKKVLKYKILFVFVYVFEILPIPGKTRE